jgi:hypothetical protein
VSAVAEAASAATVAASSSYSPHRRVWDTLAPPHCHPALSRAAFVAMLAHVQSLPAQPRAVLRCYATLLRVSYLDMPGLVSQSHLLSSGNARCSYGSVDGVRLALLRLWK